MPTATQSRPRRRPAASEAAGVLERYLTRRPSLANLKNVIMTIAAVAADAALDYNHPDDLLNVLAHLRKIADVANWPASHFADDDIEEEELEALLARHGIA